MDALEQETELRHADGDESLARAMPGTEILCVTDFRTNALGYAWPQIDELRWIHATSAGVDALLIPEVLHSDIPVTNARGIFDRAIAEYVLGQIIAFCKDFGGNTVYQQRHDWRHRDTEQVAGKRALVIGAGSIGREIAGLCQAIGVTTDGVARRARDGDDCFGAIHAQQDLLSCLPHYDFVIIAAPLTDDTRGLFDARAFEAMASQARLINIGRGPIVVTDDLVAALNSEQIAGAALDVFEEEPLPPEHPLWDLPNVRLSAHMAGDFIGWRRALTDQFVNNLRRWQRGEALLNQVDKRQGYVPPSTG
jgi:phosphoglycerate dehydrogenase-like enzyme